MGKSILRNEEGKRKGEKEKKVDEKYNFNCYARIDEATNEPSGNCRNYSNGRRSLSRVRKRNVYRPEYKKKKEVTAAVARRRFNIVCRCRRNVVER